MKPRSASGFMKGARLQPCPKDNPTVPSRSLDGSERLSVSPSHDDIGVYRYPGLRDWRRSPATRLPWLARS